MQIMLEISNYSVDPSSFVFFLCNVGEYMNDTLYYESQFYDLIYIDFVYKN